MIYLDTSAAVKLVIWEGQSAELGVWLLNRLDSTLISSDLLRVELPMAVRRRHPDKLPLVEEWLRSIDGVAVGPEVVDTAAGYPQPGLRSLDAIHLATAQRITAAASEPLEAFVSYDIKVLAIAGALGLPTASPGFETRET